MSPDISHLFWSLGGAGALLLTMRSVRIGLWLMLRPGGWAIVVFALLVLFKTQDQALAPTAQLAPIGPTLPDRARQPPPLRPQ